MKQFDQSLNHILDEACPDGFVEGSSGSIKFGMCYSRVKYPAAVDFCKAWGGKVYEPKDPAVRIPWTGGSYWIGVTDSHTEGK